jgi:hypothetical protein
MRRGLHPQPAAGGLPGLVIRPNGRIPKPGAARATAGGDGGAAARCGATEIGHPGRRWLRRRSRPAARPAPLRPAAERRRRADAGCGRWRGPRAGRCGALARPSGGTETRCAGWWCPCTMTDPSAGGHSASQNCAPGAEFSDDKAMVAQPLVGPPARPSTWRATGRWRRASACAVAALAMTLAEWRREFDGGGVGRVKETNHANVVVILGRGQLTNWQSLQNSRGVKNLIVSRRRYLVNRWRQREP